MEEIEKLKLELRKRDELIYSMMLCLSHGYQNFMVNDSVGIDELRKIFKTEENTVGRVAKKRIDKLNTY